LKDDLEPSAASGPADQLIPVRVRLVPAYFEVREEAVHSLFKGNVVCGEFVSLKVVLEIGRSETVPVDHVV